jgi:hypothetical protein
MEILQWTMIIPRGRQREFIKFHKEILGPTWQKFGAEKFELLQVSANKVNNRQTIKENEFVERLYLKEGIAAKEFFLKVKNDPEAWNFSRTYEGKFGITNIELKVLRNLHIL